MFSDCEWTRIVVYMQSFGISLWYCLVWQINKAQFDVGFSERLKLKDDVVSTILDPMWHHTSVSNCFYYVITIALSLQIV